MMKFSLQMEVYNSNGDIAPTEFIQKLVEFENTAYEMREAQKAFFNSKDPKKKDQYLKQSKELEKRFDQLLNQYGYTNTPELF